MPIQKVAIAGCTGRLGPAVLHQLLEAGFDVTAVTRQQTSDSFLSKVKVAEVDYTSLESLTNALQGHDAVISTVGFSTLADQLLLVEAAAKAGVKRFLPSEFGSNTMNPKTAALPPYKGKIAVQAALQKGAETGGMSYTLVINGPFLDWGLQGGPFADVKGRKMKFYGGGESVLSTTTLSSIGRAVVGVLKNPEATRNRAVYIQDAALSSKQLLAIAKRAIGSDDWVIENASIVENLDKAWEELRKPQPNPAIFVMNFIAAAIWGEGYGSKFDKLDNELFGIKGMSEDDIEVMIKDLAR
ncbi:NAD(P)-binding protein [Astrocystis sublimbata]|nr:NAD(P)-binding protein [Astrocystis sublimbata]